MAQLELKNLTFYYDDYYHPVFENLCLNLDSDWKIALIGRNGRGKTTLLKLLFGSLEPSAGQIRKTGSISYFPYTYDTGYRKTLDVIKECIGGLRTLEQIMEQTAETAASGQDSQSAPSQTFFDALERYQVLDGFEMESRISRELAQMKLSAQLLNRDFATLSGGEQTCMLIIALFLRKDPFVLLDEPTNHLDRTKKELLKSYLQKKKGYIIASHDTLFLDEVTDHVLAINKTDISLEQGNYATWRKNVEYQEQFELRTRQRLLKEISQLERQSQLNRTWSDIGNRQKYEFTSNARANGARAYMRQAKAAEQQIRDNLEEKKQLLRNMEETGKLRIYQEMLEADCLLSADRLSYTYAGAKVPVLKDISLRIYPGDKLWIRGHNGAGKTTLLKLLSGQLECSGITRAEGLSIGYVTQEPHWKKGSLRELLQQELVQQAISGQQNPRPERLPPTQLRRESSQQADSHASYTRLLQLCALFDLPEGFEHRPLETLSSGELRKVDTARVLSQSQQVLFLDEPLNYMDIYFKDQLLEALSDKELTIVFVEHNEDFGKQVANKILVL